MFLGALVVRLAMVAVNPTDVPVTPDKIYRYDSVAASLLDGQGFSRGGRPTEISPPAYPLLLAATYAVTGPSQVASRVVLAFVDAGICLVFFLLARRLLGPLEATLTAVGLAFSPYLVYLVLTAGSDDLFTLLLSVSLVLVGRAVASGRTSHFAVAGIAVGLATLTRATSLLLPLALAAAVIVASRQRRRTLLPCLVMLGAFVLTLTPWTVRNAVQFRRFVPIQALGGWHLLLATTAPTPDGDARHDAEDQQRTRKVPTSDQAMYRAAIDRIVADPGTFARRSLRRLGYMWYKSHSSRFDAVLAPVNFTLLALAVLGAWMVRSRWREMLHLYATVLYFIAVHSLMIVIFRYMVPVVPILIMLASVPVAYLLRRISGRSGTSEPAC